MPNTYTQLYIHLVFAVKYRANKIDKKWKDSLNKYICGIINGKKQKAFAINGMPDHIHILVSIRPDISISELVRDIKANSSKWINDQRLVEGKFQWQEGFGAFSYAKSELNNVINYINNQEKHHANQSFEMEYLKLLQEYEVAYEDRYLFEWLDDEKKVIE